VLRGIYTGASGMTCLNNCMDVISQNLANADVIGYKRVVSVEKNFPELLLRRMNDDGMIRNPFGSQDLSPVVGVLGIGVEQNEVYIDFSQGSLRETGHDFDVALDGQGFFAVETQFGERYTRNGTFLLNEQGYLVTTEGYYVLGENGRIQLKENNFVIDKTGTIYQNQALAEPADRLVSKEENEWQDTQRVDRLKLVDFKRARYLEKQGSSLYRPNDTSGEPRLLAGDNRPTVRQGFLEAANVNPITEMVRMIEVNRAYEANQKSVQSEDGLAGRLMNETIRI
jgi:flagellar basal-body rod protein FlgF